MYKSRKGISAREVEASLPTTSRSSAGLTLNQREILSRGISISPLASPAALGHDDEIYFPSYDNRDCVEKTTGDDPVELVESPAEDLAAVPGPVSPAAIERPEDDSAARIQPTRHVDYLSHEWSEEDIWSSWKHIVSNRGEYPNSERLENASWRTWEKKRRSLKTIPPQKVRWLKDHDVTWLYGPLQPASCSPDRSGFQHEIHNKSKCTAECVNKKPILKKRSLSELMLRRSVSSSMLLKQATAATDAQKHRHEATSRYNSFIFTPTPGLTRANTTTVPSLATSISNSPAPDQGAWNSKNVRFHELVEQCRSLAHLGDDEPEYHYSSDSDEDVVIMRRSAGRSPRRRLPAPKPKKKNSMSKTIEKLPHATLKYPKAEEDDRDEEDSGREDVSPSLGLGISQLPTQPAPATPDDSNDDDEDDADEYWKPPAWLKNRRDSVQLFQDKLEAVNMQTEMPVSVTTPPEPHRPVLERKNAVTTNTEVLQQPIVPTVQGKDSSISFVLPPCREQMELFSFNGGDAMGEPDADYDEDPGLDFIPGQSDYFGAAGGGTEIKDHRPRTTNLDSTRKAMVDRIMQEFWVIFNESENGSGSIVSVPTPTDQKSLIQRKTLASPDSRDIADYERYLRKTLPLIVRAELEKSVGEQREPSEAAIIGNLVGIIHDCQDIVFTTYSALQSDDPHLDGIISSAFAFAPSQKSETAFRPAKDDSSTESWSPRASSDSGYVSEDRVRDYQTGREEEKEKGVSDWELYPDAWDELDEAIAWQRGF